MEVGTWGAGGGRAAWEGRSGQWWGVGGKTAGDVAVGCWEGQADESRAVQGPVLLGCSEEG